MVANWVVLTRVTEYGVSQCSVRVDLDKAYRIDPHHLNGTQIWFTGETDGMWVRDSLENVLALTKGKPDA